MEMSKAKIKFYQYRSFGEKISAAFDFYKQNIKIILRLSLYILLPLAVIQVFVAFSDTTNSASLNYYLSMTNHTPNTNLGFALARLLLNCIALIAIISIAYTTMQEYNRLGNIENATFADMKQSLLHNAGRTFIMLLMTGIIIAVFIFVMSLLMVLSSYTLIITVPLLIFMIFLISLNMPVYIFEKPIAVTNAIGKGFRLAVRTWGSLFLLIITAIIITKIISCIFSIPYYITSFGRELLSQSNTTIVETTSIDNLVGYIFYATMIFASYLTLHFFYFCIAYHYSSASDKIEKTSVNYDLTHFDELKNPDTEEI